MGSAKKPTDIISKQDAEKLERTRQKIKELKKNVTKSYIDLAKLLEYVSSASVGGKPVYKIWGYETFSQYCEEELNMGLRKAEMLINIAKFIYNKILIDNSMKDKEDLVLSEIDEIGFAKAYLLPKVVNNAKDFFIWTEKAKNMGKRDLYALVSGRPVRIDEFEDGKTPQSVTMKFTIVPSGKEIVDAVFEHIKLNGVENYVEGPLGDGLILIRLCQHYFSNMKDDSMSPETLLKSLIETDCGIVEITAKKVNGDVVHISTKGDQDDNEKEK